MPTTITTHDGATYHTPIFLPVFQPGRSAIAARRMQEEFGVRGIIANAYLMYKYREVKEDVLARGVKAYLDFDGLTVTDSGAFQMFSGPLYLKNETIIAFQQEIGADVIAPLDVITPPGDKRTVAAKKLKSTLKRIEKGLTLTDRAILSGVQQGGRFLDLRGEAVAALVKMGAQYIALGSLVPFFNRNHDVGFIGQVIKQARQIVPPELPMHLYGGGDPLELPFYLALGCDVFDSSSFAHYARDNWFMTPYGAVQGPDALAETGYTCDCPHCATGNVWRDVVARTAHNLWMILSVLDDATDRLAAGTLDAHLDHIIETHMRWFPESKLAASWQAVLDA